MTTSVPSNSCLSCGDSRFSTTASIVGILTFVYAIYVGWFVFLKSTRGSTEQIQRILNSLQTTYQEIRTINNSLDNREPLLLASQAENKALKDETQTIRFRVEKQFKGLKAMMERIQREENGSRIKKWIHRVNFVLMQEELRTKIAEKDHLMERLRRVQDKYEKLGERESSHQKLDFILEQVQELRTTQQALEKKLASTTEGMSSAPGPEMTASD